MSQTTRSIKTDYVKANNFVQFMLSKAKVSVQSLSQFLHSTPYNMSRKWRFFITLWGSCYCLHMKIYNVYVIMPIIKQTMLFILTTHLPASSNWFQVSMHRKHWHCVMFSLNIATSHINLLKISDDLFQLLHLVMYLFKPSLLVLVQYFPLMEVKTWQKSVLKLKLFLNVIAAAYSKSGCLWNVSLLNSC